jgi:hypothetical protein
VERIGLLEVTDDAWAFPRHALKFLIDGMAFTVLRPNLFPSQMSCFVSGANDYMFEIGSDSTIQSLCTEA